MFTEGNTSLAETVWHSNEDASEVLREHFGSRYIYPAAALTHSAFLHGDLLVSGFTDSVRQHLSRWVFPSERATSCLFLIGAMK